MPVQPSEHTHASPNADKEIVLLRDILSAEHSGLAAITVLGISSARGCGQRIFLGIVDRDVGSARSLLAHSGVPSRGFTRCSAHQ